MTAERARERVRAKGVFALGLSRQDCAEPPRVVFLKLRWAPLFTLAQGETSQRTRQQSSASVVSRRARSNDALRDQTIKRYTARRRLTRGRSAASACARQNMPQNTDQIGIGSASAAFVFHLRIGPSSRQRVYSRRYMLLRGMCITSADSAGLEAARDKRKFGLGVHCSSKLQTRVN